MYLRDITHQSIQTLKYVLLFSLASNLLMLMLPIYSLQVLDRVISSASMDTLVMLTIIAIFAFVFYGIFSAVRQATCARLGEWIETTVAPNILSHTVSQTAQTVSPQGSQNMRDLATIKNFITSPGFQTLLDAPWAPLFLLIIFLVSPVLGIISIVGGGLLLVMAYLTEITTKSLTEEATRHALKAMHISDAANRNAELIEAMGMMPGVLRQWLDMTRKSMLAQARAADRNNILSAVSKSIRMLIQVAIIGFGAWLALRNEISVGGMIASSILSGRALAPFEAAIGIWKTVISFRDSYKRLNKDLSRRTTQRGTMGLPAPTGKLVAENVFYRAPNSEALILRNVNFTVEPGTLVGIIGPSAAGKSTLSKLLAGIWEATSGAVRLDGVDIFKWSREDVGRYIGYCPQDVDVFEGTIRDNIARLNPDASDEDVIAAGKMAGVHELVLRFPDGYETVIGPGLSSLSPGQKQRIGLARAVFGNPRLVVMDEPNSNLDGEGEIALIQTIGRLKQKGVTCLVVAHKPSIISHMDNILMLRAGVVEAYGPREEILPRYMNNPRANPEQAATNAGPAAPQKPNVLQVAAEGALIKNKIAEGAPMKNKIAEGTSGEEKSLEHEGKKKKGIFSSRGRKKEGES